MTGRGTAVRLALLRPLPIVGGFLVGLTGLRTWYTQHGYVVAAWPVPDVVLWVTGWLLLIVPLVMIRDLKRANRVTATSVSGGRSGVDPAAGEAASGPGRSSPRSSLRVVGGDR